MINSKDKLEYENIDFEMVEFKIVDITQCRNNCLFSHLSYVSPYHLPIAINFELLSGFHSKAAFATNYTTHTKEQNLKIFKTIYHDLSFVEALEFSRTSTFEKMFNPADFFHSFGYSFSEAHAKMSSLLAEMNDKILYSLKERRWTAADLQPLVLLKNDYAFLEKVFNQILNSNYSKTIGANCLELAVDLYLMNLSTEEIFTTTTNWLEHLKFLRYPNTRAKQEQVKAEVKLDWPSNVKTSWQRRGDRLGIELQTFISHPHEFKRTLSALEETQKQWNTFLEINK